MANPEHVELMRKGPEAIRSWSRRTHQMVCDLSKADLRDVAMVGAYLPASDLRGTYLRNALLMDANLKYAKLSDANLSDANLAGANLMGANLSDAKLYNANLRGVNFRGAQLSNTILYGANLVGANFRGANLHKVNFRDADLRDAVMSEADLSGADFSSAILGRTVIADIDLRTVRNLENVSHRGPSYVSNDTLVRSQGAIVDVFLQGCGFQPWEILNAKMHDETLTPGAIVDLQYKVFEKRTSGPLYLGGLFISYSRANDKFVDGIYARLKQEGVPVWLDRHNVEAGDLQKQITKAIRLNDVVLLVLSKDSIQSDWVESELDIARKREKTEKRDVLCPISIDDDWKAKLDDEASDRPLWRTLIKKAIIDFSPSADFETSFGKLLSGLKKNY